ncbi:MAG: dehydrogenase, short-chain alcohol dehydrogenase like, partial [Actinomycetia bacterium]|nr:dehydrogenase, short-chain alcohol dehydrogenase like [Actinomycetes bacterium]
QSIRELGGEAVANADSVSSWEGARRLVDTAVEHFGALHVLVNNAGIRRDGVIVNTTEEDWDQVVDVHLKGHFCPLHWAARHWREQSKAGIPVAAAVVNTSSGSGLFGSSGQANYSAAKAGILALTLVAARELPRYGVRVNAIAPLARTRLTEATPGLSDRIKAPTDTEQFDTFDPANVSPLVAYLATEHCPFNGQVFGISGGQLMHDVGWTVAERFVKEDRWEIAELEATMKGLPVEPPPFPVG